MSFSDHDDSLYNPFHDRHASHASATLPIQESDFESRSDQTQDKKTAEDIEESTESLKREGDQEASEPFEKLQSDEPVDVPSFSLNEEQAAEPPNFNGRQSEPDLTSQKPLDDGYRLPIVADVRAQISLAPLAHVAQHDPDGLLTTDASSTLTPPTVGPHVRFSDVLGIPATTKYKTWRAHNVYHRPTYFEDPNLELNGNRLAFQNVTSAVKFLGKIPRLPYLIGEQHPRQKIYTFGDDRPGDPAPYRVFRPTGNRKGRVLQTISTLGLVLP